MLVCMCTTAILLSLSGCDKDNIMNGGAGTTITEEDSVITVTASVTFHLQAEGASRTLSGINFDEYDVKAYIFQSEDKKPILGGWQNEWSDYKFAHIDDETNPKIITSNKTEINLPVSQKGVLLGLGDKRFKYKIVFLAAPQGSGVLPYTLKEGDVYGINGTNAATTDTFNWYANKDTHTDNAIYRDVAEINPNDESDTDKITFTEQEINANLYHKDGVLRVVVAQDILPEDMRPKAARAALTIGNIPQKMFLYEGQNPENDEVYCTGDMQEYTKTFTDIHLATADMQLEIHSLPQYQEAETNKGISCTVRLFDSTGNELASNSFKDANVYIYPNTISNVRLTATGFEFGITLEDDVWDGPNSQSNE